MFQLKVTDESFAMVRGVAVMEITADGGGGALK
jgi:hypothetical protein